ncbi:MAG: zinc ribbon domain-containing protein [Clostridia bacterium]|nr:zinc ribbon domain-containing protein [Clostridia bacterium]
MFCYKCGYKIPDDSQFCMKCGASLATPSSSTCADIDSNTDSVVSSSKSVPDSQVNSFSNIALKIYFTDLLTLECIKNKLQNDLNSLSYDIRNMEANNYYQCYHIFNNAFGDGYLHLWYDGEKIKFAAQKWGSSHRFLPTVNGYCANVFKEINYTHYRGVPVEWLSVEDHMEIFETIWQYQRYRPLFSSLGPIIKTDHAVKATCLKIYQQFQEEAPVNYKRNLPEIQKLKIQHKEIEGEFEQASQLLEQAYNVNIVPKQFRNLYAVYYLADFINTSNESLSTALLNYNMEIIKEKLDKIIEQQQEIIINQALMLAQSEKLMKQNAQQLQYLASIEQNTERAAQYAQIASNNAEACAWISLANYISK